VDKLSEQVQDFLTASALWEILCAVNWLMWRLSESVLLLLNFHVDHYQLFVTLVPQFWEFLHDMHPFCNLFSLTVNEPQFHCTPTYELAYYVTLFDWVFSVGAFFFGLTSLPPLFVPISLISPTSCIYYTKTLLVVIDTWNRCLVSSIVFLMATSCYFLDFAISLHFKDFSIDVFDTRICIYLTGFICVMWIPLFQILQTLE
jgi:hypothetical protein